MALEKLLVEADVFKGVQRFARLGGGYAVEQQKGKAVRQEFLNLAGFDGETDVHGWGP